MKKDMFDRLEAAADSESELHEIAVSLKESGQSQLEVYCSFEEYLDFLRGKGRERDLDNLIEVISYIWGWCGTGAMIFGRTMSNNEVVEYRALYKLDKKPKLPDFEE